MIYDKPKLIGRSICVMTEYRTLGKIRVEYFGEHPEEIDDFLNEIFADYDQDGDSAALLSALRVIARVKRVTTMAAEIGMTRQGLQKALSAKGNPRLDSINAIMRAMGYRLMLRSLDIAAG
jgi:HTH-type transcriptional regulator/antitoxin HigA